MQHVAVKLQVENELLNELTQSWDPFNLLLFQFPFSQAFIQKYLTKRFSSFEGFLY